MLTAPVGSGQGSRPTLPGQQERQQRNAEMEALAERMLDIYLRQMAQNAQASSADHDADDGLTTGIRLLQ